MAEGLSHHPLTRCLAVNVVSVMLFRVSDLFRATRSRRSRWRRTGTSSRSIRTLSCSIRNRLTHTADTQQA